MKKMLFFSFTIIVLFSCKLQSSADSSNTNDSTVYRLGLQPAVGSQYHYSISNESEVTMEVEDKEIENRNTSDVGVNYLIAKDSVGNYLLKMTYDNIRLYTKSGEKETTLDAANAATSLDPVERMLGILQKATITATVNSKGEVKQMSGYKEVGNQLLAGFDEQDTHSKTVAQEQWDKMIGQGLIKKNIDQLFAIFPDSAVRRGDKWKISSKASGEFGLQTETFYQLKAINDAIVLIESEGTLASDPSASHVNGINALADLKGTQQGQYEMDAKTGMLINCTITSKLDGTVQMMGRGVPIVVETHVKMKGKKVK